MTTITHGSNYVVDGTGFDAHSGDELTWDDCSGTDPLTIWDVAKPDGSGSVSAGANIDYRTKAGAGRNVDMPHARISQYLCGAHNPRTDANNGQNVYIARDFTRPSFPYYSYWHWYARLDPNWVFDSGGVENHKWYGFSTGNGSIYNLPNNWYIEFKGGTDWEGPTDDAQWHTNDDAGGTGLSLGGSFSVYGGMQTNPVGAWVKRELCIKWQSSTAGFLKGWADNAVMYDETGKTDGYTGTTRCEGIEGYSGNGNSANWRFIADIGYIRGAGVGRFMLTDNATYASSTKVEFQPIVSAGATQYTLTGNGGALTDGTVHLHYRDEVNGHQYIGSYTLGEAASNPPAGRVVIRRGSV